MKKKNTYSPVKGCQYRGFFGGASSLWFSDDHLLLVRREGWKESYRKFYFQDIQALVIVKNKQRRSKSIIFLLTILFFLVLASLSGEVGRMVYLIISSLVFIFFLTNLLKGATCTVQIITAVQTSFLPCKFLPVAQRLQKNLNVSIQQIQGNFTADHLKQAANKLEEQEKLEEFSLFFNNRAHLRAYFLFLLLACISTVSLRGRTEILYLFETIVFLFILAALVVALYRQSRSRVKGMLEDLTWLAAFLLMLSVLANFGLLEAIFRQILELETMPSKYEVWVMLGQVQPADSLYLRILLITRILCFGLLGGFGLLFSFKAGERPKDD